MAPVSHLVIDECHRSAAQSYQAIIDEARALNPEVKLLGLSATPGAAMAAACAAPSAMSAIS
jgi:DNA repair protein RadD